MQPCQSHLQNGLLLLRCDPQQRVGISILLEWLPHIRVLNPVTFKRFFGNHDMNVSTMQSCCMGKINA